MKQMKPKSIVYNKTDEEFRLLIASSVSYAEALRCLGLSIHGSSGYNILLRRIRALSIDTSHMLGRGANKGKRHKGGTKAVSLSTLLVTDNYLGTNRLRKRLIKEGVLENKCSVCFLPGMWQNKELTLHLDHINGINSDNRLSNLRILCPNCHSQTDTYCGKNKGKNGAPCRTPTGTPEGTPS